MLTFSLVLRPYQLKVLASWFLDLSAGWFISLFATKDFWVLTYSFTASIMCLYLAFQLEGKAEVKL